MSQIPPQTISIKRKRNAAPVDALRFDEATSIKRQRNGPAPKQEQFIFRRLTKPDEEIVHDIVPPTPNTERRFHLDPIAKAHSKHVFIEERQSTENGDIARKENAQNTLPESTPQSTPRPRKRPGAGSALRPPTAPRAPSNPNITEPSETDVRNLEALSKEIEKVDNLLIPLPSPPRYKPRAPARRFADRHPDKAAALAAQDTSFNDGDADAMDIDTDDYVIDTFIRETILPSADGTLPLPTGTVGFIVIGDEDDDWWTGDSDSDKEFATDDEDENAEDYYANEYPEDELSEDDELGRDVYQKKYRRGSSDEEFNLSEEDGEVEGIGSGEDEDDLHFKMTVPKVKRVYWGAKGEGEHATF